MSLRNNAARIGNYCDAVLSGEIVTSAVCWHSSSLRYIVACVLLRIILTELDREIAGLGWCVNAGGLGESQPAKWQRAVFNFDPPAPVQKIAPQPRAVVSADDLGQISEVRL